MISKEILYLKSFSKFKDLYNSRVDLTDGIYVLPISEVNYDLHSKYIDNKVDKDEYLNKESFFYFNIFDHTSSIKSTFKLSQINNDIVIDVIFINKKSISSFSKTIILDIINWIDTLFLTEYIYVLNTNLNYELFRDNLETWDDDKFLINKKKFVGDKMILTAGPSIGTRERVYSADATQNGWNNQWSFYLSNFEKEFAQYVGVKYAIATSSCTGAMHIALSALDIKPGDEVIVPDITWVSTANAVMLSGATPVFADVDIDTWTLDVKSVDALISKRTKAIMPVHLYGHPAKMDKLIELAKKNNLYVIEDAAPSIGAEYNGKKTGSFGDFAAFSFQGAKLLVTGEGGMLCTNDKSLYDRAFKIWDQGRVPGTFWIEELSSKYKMSNIQASIGLGQLQRNDMMVNKKRMINNWYYDRLKGFKEFTFFRESTNVKSICWMSCIILNSSANISRDDLCKRLKQRNIDTRPVFPSISQYPYWDRKQKQQPNSKFIADNAINLPSGVCLKREEVEYVCDTIIEIFKKD